MWPRTPRTMRHVITNIRFAARRRSRRRDLDLDRLPLRGRRALRASPMAVGDYEDEFRRDADGRWRIQRRKIVIAFLNQELLAAARSDEARARPIASLLGRAGRRRAKRRVPRMRAADRATYVVGALECQLVDSALLGAQARSATSCRRHACHGRDPEVAAR